MKAALRSLLVFLIALGAVGCASTRVVVQKVPAPGSATSAPTDAKTANGATNTAKSVTTATAEPVGLRYSLPKPFLLVTPNAKGDGAFSAEVIYLPDENATYAIDASTRRGKYSLDVQVKDGLLAKVAWTAANATVAAESARVAGELVKAQLADEQKDRDEGEAEAKAEAKAAKEAREKLEADLETKELDLQLAEAELESARDAAGPNPSPEARVAVRAAELKMRQATIRRDAARSKLDSTAAAAAGAGDAFNEPTTEGTAAKPPDRSKFWGPVLYAIEDNGTTVMLKAVVWNPEALKQVPFETVPPPASEPPQAPRLVDGSERAFTWPAGANTHTITASLTGAIKALRTNERTMFLKLADENLQAIVPPKFNVVMDAEGKTLTITFTERLAAGRYQIFIPFLWGEKSDDGGVTINIVAS